MVLQMTAYSLSISPKPCSYLFHVWSNSTEPSTLRWMTVEPPPVELIKIIFWITSFCFYNPFLWLYGCFSFFLNIEPPF